MAQGRLESVAGQVRRLFGEGTVIGLSERQLLERFVARRDPAAFEAIVARHGSMVLGVCRRWLDDPNDADDAFQATFLVLVRRARDLRERDLLANWLYGVATRVARRTRQQAARRRDRERLAAGARAEEAMTADDLGPELHEELARLPGSYRKAIVLCYLEGRTHEEAAFELGWPLGTVKGRLARARDLLRERLVRRGLAVTSTVLVAALQSDAATLVRPALMETTVQAAGALGHAVVVGVVSASVATLTAEVSRTMGLSKIITIGAVGALAVSLGAGGIAYSQRGEGPAGGASPSPAQEGAAAGTKAVSGRGSAAGASSELADLQRVRVEAARRSLEVNEDHYLRGQITLDRLIAASERLMQAERDAMPKDSVSAAQRHLNRMQAVVDRLRARVEEGVGSLPDHQEAEVALAEARLNLARPASQPPGTQSQPPSNIADMYRGMMGGAPPPTVVEEGGREVLMGGGAGFMAPGGTGAGAGFMAPGGTGAGAGSPSLGSEPGMPGGMAPGMMPGGMPMGGGGGITPPTGLPNWLRNSVRIGASGDIDEELATRLAQASRNFGKVVDRDERSLAIQEKLEKVCSVAFQDEVPLAEALSYIQTVTSDQEQFPKGIPIYLDEVTIKEENDATGNSPIKLNLEGVKLRTCLRLMLQQVQLSYVVKDGLVFISSPMGLLDEIEREPEE